MLVKTFKKCLTCRTYLLAQASALLKLNSVRNCQVDRDKPTHVYVDVGK